MILKNGNVIKDHDANSVVVGSKYTTLKDGDCLPEGYVFICEKPHGDGSYSYLCQSRYCRCGD